MVQKSTPKCLTLKCLSQMASIEMSHLKYLSQNVSLRMSHIKCLIQNVSLKMRIAHLWVKNDPHHYLKF